MNEISLMINLSSNFQFNNNLQYIKIRLKNVKSVH